MEIYWLKTPLVVFFDRAKERNIELYILMKINSLLKLLSEKSLISRRLASILIPWIDKKLGISEKQKEPIK